jgi:hypothetical protein
LGTGAGELRISEDLAGNRFAWQSIHDKPGAQAVVRLEDDAYIGYRESGRVSALDQARFSHETGSNSASELDAVGAAAQNELPPAVTDGGESPCFLTRSAG